MQERALLLGADLRVESAQGSGTTVTLRMPFKDESTTEQDAHEDIDR
jgi:nitrate/nitrite-specific signal transduction histidine kinase